MNPLVELNLALILFVPWFAILAVLFWLYPRQPRNLARTLFDSTSLVVATSLAAFGMYWSMENADPQHGHMWQQILATSISYGLFLAAMTLAIVLRWRWLRGRRRSDQASVAASPGAASDPLRRSLKATP